MKFTGYEPNIISSSILPHLHGHLLDLAIEEAGQTTTTTITAGSKVYKYPSKGAPKADMEPEDTTLAGTVPLQCKSFAHLKT